MREIKLALMGFGDAGRAFARMLLEKEQDLEKTYDTRISVVAITTGTRGNLVDPEGIDLNKALGDVEKTGRFQSKALTKDSALTIAEGSEYDVLIELTPLEFFSGKTASSHIRAALARGKHAITANKGPVAWAFRELTQLAKENRCLFLYETTVMDGAPIFNLKHHTLKMCQVTEIKGILNSTTNFILGEMALGKTDEAILKEGTERGFIEADPAFDIEGYDPAAKITVLANVLMDADLKPTEVDRTGIQNVTREDIKKAADKGKVIKLLCFARQENGKVKAKVAPEALDKADFYAAMEGTTSVVSLTTDLMGTISIVEQEPEIQQTAYGIFSDLLEVLTYESI